MTEPIDEARETIKDLECEIAIRVRAARAQKDRADAAERQLAEARAVLAALEEAHRGWCNYCHGEIKYCDTRPECHCPKAREIARGAPSDGWRPIETAPNDGTRIYVTGYWDDRAAPQSRGKSHTCIAAWSSFRSDGTGHEWIYEGCLGNMTAAGICVTFTHWRPLPEPFA